MDKLIKNMDDKVWREFAGHCKAKGVKINDCLADVLSNYLQQQNKGLK